MTCLKLLLDVIDLLERCAISEDDVTRFLERYGANEFEVRRLRGSRGETLFVKVCVRGIGGDRTLGVIGRLGGVGVRPHRVGLVSDADGAIVALTVAAKLSDMARKGDRLKCDVIVTTHVSTHSPIIPHEPKPFVGSPVDLMTLLKREVDPEMDAILSVDATKANRVIKVEGFAITPTVKEGIVLKVSDDLIDVYEVVMDRPAAVVPITMQDILPPSVGVYHINTMMLPWLLTDAPVVGVATTARLPIAGCETGANYVMWLERAATFCVEVAKRFGEGKCRFYDEDEFRRLKEIYGDLAERIRRLVLRA